jgi:short-subunit dehydrogenase
MEAAEGVTRLLSGYTRSRNVAEGQVEPAIVVTGASSGIGRELARVAAREGAFMMLIGRSQQPLEQLAQELSARGTAAAAQCIDLTDRHAGEQIERALSDRGMYCDILINSAGFGLFGPAAEIDRNEQLDLLDVNARALTELTLRFLPAMVARRRGGILNVGSITGYSAGPNMAVYYASKAYVRFLSAALAAEVANSGVTITCLCPGPVRTAFFERCKVGQTRLAKIMPRANASDTAEAGWRGFKAGKSLVIPRPIDRMIATLAVLVPASILVRLVGALQQASPRSSEQSLVAQTARDRLRDEQEIGRDSR